MYLGAGENPVMVSILTQTWSGLYAGVPPHPQPFLLNNDLGRLLGMWPLIIWFHRKYWQGTHQAVYKRDLLLHRCAEHRNH